MECLKPEPGTVIADLSTVKCAMDMLLPNQEFQKSCHATADKVYLFLEGSGEITASNGQQIEPFDAPMLADIPASTPYALTNTGKQKLTFVWALAPNEISGEKSRSDRTASVVMLGTEKGERFPESQKIRGGMLTFPANTECDYHSHDGADEVFFFLEGHGEVDEEGEVVRVRPGDVVVTPAERKHKLRSFDDPLVMWLTVTPNQVPSHTFYQQLDDGSWKRTTPLQ